MYTAALNWGVTLACPSVRMWSLPEEFSAVFTKLCAHKGQRVLVSSTGLLVPTYRHLVQVPKAED